MARPKVPLLTSVAALVEAKELSYTDAGEVIDSFVGISTRCTILRAVVGNDHRLLRRLVAMQQPEHRDSVVSALEIAAEYGYLAILQALYPYSPTSNSGGEQVGATARGDVSVSSSNVLTWIRRWKDDDCFAVVITKAAESNHVEVVKWLIAHLPAWCTSLEVKEFGNPHAGHRINAIEAAARHGQLELLQLFHSSGVGGWTKFVLKEAASAGHLAVVKWIHAHRPDEELGAWQFDGAIINGHVDVVQYAWSQGVGPFDSYYLRPGSWSGNLDMVKFLLEHYRDEYFEHAMGGAVSKGHLHIVHYLQDHGVDTFCSNNLDDAASEGHMGVIKWAYENHNVKQRCTVRGLMEAIEHGHLSVIKYLLEFGVERSTYPPTGYIKYVLPWAATRGYYEVVKLILEHEVPVFSGNTMDGEQSNASIGSGSRLVEKHTVECITAVLDNAAAHGHLNLVRYLHENRTEGCTTSAMDGAAKNGHLDVVKYLHDHRSEGCTTNAMDYAARCGHLNVVQFLHAHRAEGCTTNAQEWAGTAGHRDVVQWLGENLKEGYAIDPSSSMVSSSYFDCSDY